MSAITEALSRQGAMKSGALYEKVKADFGSLRSFERALADEPALLRLGSRRSRTYAIQRLDVPSAPIYLRDEEGIDFNLGSLLSLEADQWAFDHGTFAKPWMKIGWLENGDLPVYQGLPWFMDAFRPAGFLGRAWVRAHAAAHGWPLDIEAWTADQILVAAMQVPWDWRGNLSVGPFEGGDEHIVTPANRKAEYAKKADLVMEGVMVGASADGEQPKFTAVVTEAATVRPVIVKFSGRLTGDPAARRWADIIVTEAVANQVMTLYGLDAARTEVWTHADRVWLETTRFDRVSARGRRAMVSLRALARTFNYNGPQNGWVGAVQHLARRGVIDARAVEQATHLATIGHLLLNNDMHMGNLSFIVGHGWPHPFTVAPMYDMAPMRWVPSVVARVVPALQEEPIIATGDREAVRIAAEIWEATALHDLVSEEWRRWAADRAQQIRQSGNALGA